MRSVITTLQQRPYSKPDRMAAEVLGNVLANTCQATGHMQWVIS